MAVPNYRQLIGLYKYTSVLGEGRISTHADPASTHCAISRTALM